MYYTYLLECADGTLYCGYTTDVDARVKTHNSGKGAKYTKSRLPVKVVWSKALDTKSEAMSLEAKIKRLTREQKRKLINSIS
ncbi:MAG: GIY-YIG nuclease family protein [Clostridia bacterium]|nr:GIY-YIG nuclease family protein [Clostridia bacterium]